MANKVFFIEDFHDVPEKIKGYIERGWTVYNAPRPILGHEIWQSDFRHGIFYAAVAPEDDPVDEFGDASRFHKRNLELDGSICQIMTRADVMAYGAMMTARYGCDLADFSYEEIATSYIGWLQRQ